MGLLSQEPEKTSLLPKIVYAIFLFAILIISCIFFYYLSAPNVQKTTIGDGGFLSQQPCGPPCFQGIYPGATTERDARIALQKLGKPCTDWDNTSVGGFRGTNCGNITVSFADQTVNGVSFNPASDITVSQMIGKYGPPDRMIVFISSI